MGRVGLISTVADIGTLGSDCSRDIVVITAITASTIHSATIGSIGGNIVIDYRERKNYDHRLDAGT